MMDKSKMVYATFGINSTIKKMSPVCVLFYCLSSTFTCPYFIMSLDVCHYCSRVSCWWRWTSFLWLDMIMMDCMILGLSWAVCVYSHRNSLQNQKVQWCSYPPKKTHYCVLYWASSFHLPSLQLAYLTFRNRASYI